MEGEYLTLERTAEAFVEMTSSLEWCTSTDNYFEHGGLAAVHAHVRRHRVQTAHVEDRIKATRFRRRRRDWLKDGRQPVAPLLQRPQVRHQIVLDAQR